MVGLGCLAQADRRVCSAGGGRATVAPRSPAALHSNSPAGGRDERGYRCTAPRWALCSDEPDAEAALNAPHYSPAEVESLAAALMLLRAMVDAETGALLEGAAQALRQQAARIAALERVTPQ